MLGIFLFKFQNTNTKLVSSNISTPAPTSFNQPKEIKYDSATDLKKELDTVNPQILDSDFGK